MMGPAAMDKTELAMFHAIEKVFYQRVTLRLSFLGYMGSFKEPYDESKSTSEYEADRILVKNMFETAPRPVSAGFRKRGGIGCRFFIDADRKIERPQAKWLVDLASDKVKRMPGLVNLIELNPPRGAVLLFTDKSTPEEVLQAFGIDPFDTELGDDFEDIEVDINDPLALDFPLPVDIL